MNTVLQFFHDMLSGGSTVSFGRCASGLLIVAVIAWDSFYIFWHHTPVASAELLGQATFMMAPYVVTKTGETIQKGQNGAKP